jgi:hypothetical protein
MDQATKLINDIFKTRFPLVFNKIIFIKITNMVELKKRKAIEAYLKKRYNLEKYNFKVLSLALLNYIAISLENLEVCLFYTDNGGYLYKIVVHRIDNYKRMRTLEGSNLIKYFQGLGINYKNQINKVKY